MNLLQFINSRFMLPLGYAHGFQFLNQFLRGEKQVIRTFQSFFENTVLGHIARTIGADLHCHTADNEKAHILHEPQLCLVGCSGFIPNRLIHIGKNETTTLTKQFLATVIKGFLISSNHGILI